MRPTILPLMLLLAMSQWGCAMRLPWQPRPDFPPGKCCIPPTISKEQLVLHLNRNIRGSAHSPGVTAWRATSAKITATGMPPGFSAPASIAVESPRNFRLRVSEPMTRLEALDMGANDHEFWFWARDAQPQQVLTISHADLPAAQQKLQVPFHPDWLMEVFGVVPLEDSDFTLQRSRADAPVLELVAETITPTGDSMKKVIRVDACHGIIREHALYDARGVLIARAALADHRIDRETGLTVAHVISFDWPAMRQSMKVALGTVELNPPSMPSTVWQIPHKPGAPQFNLSQLLDDEQPELPYGVASPFGLMPSEDPAAGDGGFPEEGAAPGRARGTTTYEGGVPVDLKQNPATPLFHSTGVPRTSRAHLTQRPFSWIAAGRH